ncbi:hypothetical protein SNEBB_002282 [Seison nebaliae]|nr:hypothetical protein SNEBB_002282 [Seison nebaliae]
MYAWRYLWTLNLLIFNFNFLRVGCDEHTHHYKNDEEVVLWMNTVGPYHNRQETYSYYSLPYCVGPRKSISHYHETLGENLLGVELEFSGLDLKFLHDIKTKSFCDIDLTQLKLDAFKYAIENDYWYQTYIDDLPAWAIVGEYVDDQPSIYTIRHIDISYNNGQIIQFNLTTSGLVPLTLNRKISFRYSVKWHETKDKFEDRFNRYLDHEFFQHRIHWFSIFNSFMMVIFLVGLVFMILIRTIRKDFIRSDEENDYSPLNDEYGWKLIHGDVFRPPSNLIFFCSLIANGAHAAIVTLVVVLLANVGELYNERGSLLSTVIFIYSICAIVNGFVGGSYYSKMGGQYWIRQLIISASLVPLTVAFVAFVINFVAMYYHASRAIPFTSMLIVISICLFVILPLTLIGTIMGRAILGHCQLPCRINALPRALPSSSFFLSQTFMMLAGGLLPFGSIFIEMYFIFTSFWAYKIYYVFGFMLLVFIILCIVTICVSIVATYFLLNSEDYRWQWNAFMTGASTSLYVYFYSVYYFLIKTKMYGMFQTTFYFGYMALFSLGIGIICGAVGYVGARLFVFKIYSTLKID